MTTETPEHIPGLAYWHQGRLYHPACAPQKIHPEKQSSGKFPDSEKRACAGCGGLISETPLVKKAPEAEAVLLRAQLAEIRKAAEARGLKWLVKLAAVAP